LRIIGGLVIAATIQLSSWCQQQTAENAVQAEGAGQDAAAAEHTVNPPKVVCHGNTLSVSANYSRLGEILTEIQKCTGVQFDAPETAKLYLVFDEIGPASSSDVLASLLNSSGFDYVIGASEADPDKIEKIVLLSRTDDKNPASADQRGLSPQRRAFSQMREAARPKTPEEQLAATAEADKSGDEPSGSSQPAPAAPESTSTPEKSDHSATKPGADATATNADAPPAQPPPDAAASAKPADDASAPNADAAPSQPAQDTASPAKPLSPSEERIANMEKLFEQRRQLQQQQAPQQSQPQHPAPQ
jgi:hypothetical protein